LSALTKLFVILLIVCSMLLTGGVVVFINRTEGYKELWTKAQDEVRKRETEKDAAETLARTAQNREVAAVNQSNNKITELQTTIAQLTKEIGDRSTTVNTKDTQIHVLTAQNTDATSSLKNLNESLKDLQARYDAIVKQNGELQIRNAEFVGANTEVQKKNEALERELRAKVEELVQVKAERDKAREIIAQAGLDNPNRVGPRVPRVAPAVSGYVKSVRTEGGQTFAVISLGAADRIDKGMQFNITDPNTSTFLGKITIDTVEANESFGRVEGPRVADIQPNQSRVLPQ
jgi:hypothetical protein